MKTTMGELKPLLQVVSIEGSGIVTRKQITIELFSFLLSTLTFFFGSSFLAKLERRVT